MGKTEGTETSYFYFYVQKQSKNRGKKKKKENLEYLSSELLIRFLTHNSEYIYVKISTSIIHNKIKKLNLNSKK